MRAWQTGAVVLGLLGTVVACGVRASGVEGEGEGDGALRVDTSSPAARAQHAANVAFAEAYRARCPVREGGGPRVLLTGFGRFGAVTDNATGRMVSAIVPDAPYPLTRPPADGEVDAPGPQVSVGLRRMRLPGVEGEVEVCGMILPVYWDLSAILVAKEIDAFRPSFVLMNGVSGSKSKLVLELGAVNAASGKDGSNRIGPALDAGTWSAPLLVSAGPSERARPNLLSWTPVRDAAARVIEDNAGVEVSGERLDAILPGVAYGGFPRDQFLCNGITWTTGWLMDHPGTRVRLLEPSAEGQGLPPGVEVGLEGDHRAVPRVFLHWPERLAREHLGVATDVLEAVMGAQLAALARGEAPTRGDPALADPDYRAWNPN